MDIRSFFKRKADTDVAPCLMKKIQLSELDHDPESEDISTTSSELEEPPTSRHPLHIGCALKSSLAGVRIIWLRLLWLPLSSPVAEGDFLRQSTRETDGKRLFQVLPWKEDAVQSNTSQIRADFKATRWFSLWEPDPPKSKRPSRKRCLWPCDLSAEYAWQRRLRV
ncbi:hypothetical protein HPB52_023113 [Rhipicephalus sanguineus]|uniref:Uncharacterized protein n=1 Tax=Rhipicephalus sanguineus TaxID=34632 RepID=A0A9D4SNC1_RHISA|nr:hypothetical protein HPB52_023113 [Rhipicephalus sanguineus]